jgi:DNA-directed RNA polymerase specialized sigma24 family protein
MSLFNDGRPLADRLRDDEATWRLVESEVVPRVLAALQRRYGPGRHWHDLEGFVRSAERTAWRRLRAVADPRLEELETLAQFERWLVVVAAHKFCRALTRSAAEQACGPLPGNSSAPGDLLDELTRQSAAEVLDELEAGLEDEVGRAVFRGKLEQKTEAEIAAGLKCSTRKVRGVWRLVRRRLLRRASELASEGGAAQGKATA